MLGQEDNVLQMYFFLKFNELASELGIPGGENVGQKLVKLKKVILLS